MSLGSRIASSPRVRVLLAVLTAAVAYAASSSGMILHPSPHFHFVDMAWNLMHGRVDTDTPRRAPNQTQKPEDPRGINEAVNRHLLGKDGKNQGWNDWASYRVLTLKGGEVVRGVFPWKDLPAPRNKEFRTLDGRMMVIDVDKELRTGCKPGRAYERCDDVVYQVSFPPLPAIVMMPLVAIWGYDVNDTLVTLLFALASVLLFSLWIERLASRGVIATSPGDRLWLAALMAFGTVTWYCSIRGQVWFTALVVGLTIHFAYLWFGEGARRPFWAGVMFGLGVAARTPILFAGLFVPLEAAFERGQPFWREGAEGWKRFAVKMFWFALPAAAIGAGLAWFNWIRWDNPLEFGHLYLLEGTRGPTRDHGLFNTIFLNNNLAAAVTNMPRLMLDAPFMLVTRHGLGLLASTPALFALFGKPRRDALPSDDPAVIERKRLERSLFWTMLAVVLPGLVYQNDGWQQFAYRFSMDFLPLLLGLFALRVQKLSRGVKVLIVLSILVQLFGAITFGRFEQFYYD